MQPRLQQNWERAQKKAEELSDSLQETIANARELEIGAASGAIKSRDINSRFDKIYSPLGLTTAPQLLVLLAHANEGIKQTPLVNGALLQALLQGINFGSHYKDLSSNDPGIKELRIRVNICFAKLTNETICEVESTKYDTFQKQLHRLSTCTRTQLGTSLRRAVAKGILGNTAGHIPGLMNEAVASGELNAAEAKIVLNELGRTLSHEQARTELEILESKGQGLAPMYETWRTACNSAFDATNRRKHKRPRISPVRGSGIGSRGGDWFDW